METQKQKEDMIINLLKNKPNWAFSVIDIVKETGNSNPYPILNMLIAKKIVDRKWFNNCYCYYLIEEWDKSLPKTQASPKKARSHNSGLNKDRHQ